MIRIDKSTGQKWVEAKSTAQTTHTLIKGVILNFPMCKYAGAY